VLSILFMTFLPCVMPQEPGVFLIAHRGGVVDEDHPENTLASLQEAIHQGYWMVEVDVRESKDGELIVQHDASFLRTYGDRHKVGDLTWEQIRNLRSRIGSQAPMRFEDLAAYCRGKIRLMVDSKEDVGANGAYEKMEQILRDNDLLDTAFLTGEGGQKAYFKGKGKARVAVSRDELKQRAAAGEDVSSLCFLFGHGSELDNAALEDARALNVPVVASINTFHYPRLTDTIGPGPDIQRLLDENVIYFQIDSAYARYIPKALRARDIFAWKSLEK
jgi:glycerophosphoryl diester phosphodiesterase